jgi:hypothetical protein
VARRTLAVLVLAAALGACLAAPAPASAGCQPESCPPPCPFERMKYLELLCPQPV